MNSSRIQYMAVSGVTGINGSLHYVESDDFIFLLDAGLDPSDPFSSLQKLETLPKAPDALFISHAHLDHIGLLPEVVLRFPRIRIFMTYPTAVLTEIMLFHNYKIMGRKWGELKKRYGEPFIEQLPFLFQSKPYKKPFICDPLRSSDVLFTFYDAGHILGSAGVLAKWRKYSLFYSGNFRMSRQTILKGALFPKHKVNTLILEGTYGQHKDAHLDYKVERKRFATFLKERLTLNGTVLMPVFALGRTQEILMQVSVLMRKKQIPVAPIYITGMGTRITKIYDRLIHKYDRHYPNIKLRPLANHLNTMPVQGQPQIIIATSGMMLEGSFSHTLSQKIMNNPANGIALVGYASPETPAGQLYTQKETSEWLAKFNGCKIESFNFSAHANQTELSDLVQRLRPENVILFHGEEEALYQLAERLRHDGYSGIITIPEEMKIFPLN